jgi:hypothetical protein
LPITTYAETYNLGGTDMSISVDDTVWYVFTRDNIKNNSELEELGITYEAMYEILHNNEAYMDAILYYENGEYTELFVRKRALDTGIANLSNYKDSEVLELAKELAKKQGASTYSVYENQYKFAKMEYIDSNYGYYICEYVTCVNKDNYTFTFQSTSQFTDEEYAEIENIVDSIKFDVDTSIKEKKSTSIAESVIEKTIGGAVIGGVVGAVIAIINKKKKKTAETGKAENANETESNSV